MSRSYQLSSKSQDPGTSPVPTIEPSTPPSLLAAGFFLRPPLRLSIPGPRPHCPLQTEPEPGPWPAGPPPCPPQPLPAAKPSCLLEDVQPLRRYIYLVFSQNPPAAQSALTLPPPRRPLHQHGGPHFTYCRPSDLPARPRLPWCVGFSESLLTPGPTNGCSRDKDPTSCSCSHGSLSPLGQGPRLGTSNCGLNTQKVL